MAVETSEDDFLGGALKVSQRLRGHRSGIDAVLLAAACPARAGDAVADLGAGVGVAALCVLRRVEDTRATLLEIDAGACALAGANLARNGMSGRGRVIEADIAARAAAAAAGFARPAFDHIIANPPFETLGRARVSPDAARATAHAAEPGALEQWVRFAASIGRAGASLTIIHRADALQEVLDAMRGRFGGVTLRAIHPRAGEPANRIVLRGLKGSRAPLAIVAPLVLHGDAGHEFAPEAEAALRHGAPLAMD